MNTQQKPIISFEHEGFNIFVYDCGPNAYFYVEDEMIGQCKCNFSFLPWDWKEQVNLNLEMFEDKNRVLDYLSYHVDHWNGRFTFTNINLAVMYGVELAMKIEKTFTKMMADDPHPYEYSDNHRIAECGNVEQELLYEKARKKGCCGFYDEIMEVDGRHFKVGFNYGH